MSTHYILGDPDSHAPYRIAILIRLSALSKKDMFEYYLNPLTSRGIPPSSIVMYSLDYKDSGKAPVGYIKDYMEGLFKALDSNKVDTLLIADPNYFKVLTGSKQADANYGYVLPCVLKGHEHFKCILTLNYKALFYNPTARSKLNISLDTLQNEVNGLYLPPGTDVFHSESYPKTITEIMGAVNALHKHPVISCDIETYSLDFDKAGIGTIAFAWDKHNGIAFCVDDRPTADVKDVRALLTMFFCQYKGKILYHNAAYDVKILIYELFMKDLLDLEGLQHGLRIMYRDTDCTKIITYLATNTTAGNKLDLKSNAQEYLGNYAQDDIKDITKIPTDDLLRYNLSDCLGTHFVYSKNWPILLADGQLDTYRTIFHPGMSVITQMELHGMPMDMNKVTEAADIFQNLESKYHEEIKASPLLNTVTTMIQQKACDKHNANLKVKVVTLNDHNEEFNPNSGQHIAMLLHDDWNIPIVDKTDGGAPSTGADTLKKHLAYLRNKFNFTEEETK